MCGVITWVEEGGQSWKEASVRSTGTSLSQALQNPGLGCLTGIHIHHTNAAPCIPATLHLQHSLCHIGQLHSLCLRYYAGFSSEASLL